GMAYLGFFIALMLSAHYKSRLQSYRRRYRLGEDTRMGSPGCVSWHDEWQRQWADKFHRQADRRVRQAERHAQRHLRRLDRQARRFGFSIVPPTTNGKARTERSAPPPRPSSDTDLLPPDPRRPPRPAD